MSLSTREEIEKRFAEIHAEPEPNSTEGEGTPPAETVAEQVAPEPPAATEAPAAPTIDPLAEALEAQRKADARYYTLQGEHKRLKEEAEERNRMIAELQAKSVIAPPVNKVDEAQADADYQFLSDEFGEPAAKIMINQKSKAVAETKAELDALREEVKKAQTVTAQLATHAAQTTQSQFYAELSAQVPDWQEINSKAAEFYQQTEPFTGRTYDELIQHYGAQGDVGRVKQILSQAKQSIAPVIPEVKPANPLEMLLEPEKTGKGTAPPKDTTAKIFTRAEVDRIKQDYTDSQTGRLKVDHAKMQAKLEEVKSALADGRVR